MHLRIVLDFNIYNIVSKHLSQRITKKMPRLGLKANNKCKNYSDSDHLHNRISFHEMKIIEDFCPNGNKKKDFFIIFNKC